MAGSSASILPQCVNASPVQYFFRSGLPRLVEVASVAAMTGPLIKTLKPRARRKLRIRSSYLQSDGVANVLLIHTAKRPHEPEGRGAEIFGYLDMPLELVPPPLL